MYDVVKPIEQRPRTGTGGSVGASGRMSLPVIWVDKTSVIPESVRGSVLSIGKFDGVHLGHLNLAKTAVFLAENHRTKAIAVTFEPAPPAILRPDIPVPPPLTPLERKVRLLKESGFDDVAVFRTGTWLLELEARAFFDEIIRDRFEAVGLVEGPDFTFGKSRIGQTNDLSKWCPESGMTFAEVPPVELAGSWVTSSRIRKVLSEGDLSLANQLMGRPLITRGTVVRGAGRGRTIQVPTANLENCDTILPAPGVYAATAKVVSESGGSDCSYPAAVNIGHQPTFSSQAYRLEVHMMWIKDEDLYGELIEVKWLRRVRETRKFDSIEDLIGQIGKDLELCRIIASTELVE